MSDSALALLRIFARQRRRTTAMRAGWAIVGITPEAFDSELAARDHRPGPLCPSIFTGTL